MKNIILNKTSASLLPFNLKILSLIILLLAFSCNENNSKNYETEGIKSESISNFEVSAPQNGTYSSTFNGNASKKRRDVKAKNVLHKRKLIKTGEIKYATDDINKSRQEIEKLVKKFGAFISNEENNNYNYKLEQSISVRIPFENFDSFLNELSGTVSKFDYKNINVKDVTEEYIDIQSRLKAKYKLEESFLALLKKALKIKDILEIEKELNNVRTEIERMEGRMRYLKDQVSLSTLNIVFYKTLEREYVAEKGFFAKLWYNFQDGFSSLLTIILNIVSIWPVLLILFSFLFFIRRWFRKRDI